MWQSQFGEHKWIERQRRIRYFKFSHFISFISCSAVTSRSHCFVRFRTCTYFIHKFLLLFRSLFTSSLFLRLCYVVVAVVVVVVSHVCRRKRKGFFPCKTSFVDCSGKTHFYDNVCVRRWEHFVLSQMGYTILLCTLLIIFFLFADFKQCETFESREYY